MDGPRLLRIVSWLRHPDKVTSLGIAADSITPDAVKKTISAMPALTSLSLSGKKITNAVLTHTAKQPGARNLTTLKLTDISGSTHASEAAKLLQVTSKLTSLSIASHLGNEDTLSGFAHTLRTARGGGSPLLKTLDLTKSFGGTCTWASMRKFGTLFPELEELHINTVNDSHYGDSAHRSLTFADSFSMVRLPRLKVLKIDELSGFTCNMGSDEFNIGFKGVFEACPVLEVLKIKHGMMWTGGSAPKPMQPLPTADQDTFDELPESLKILELEQILFLTTEVFDTAHLPNLKSLTFKKCGIYAEAIAKKLVDVYPKLVEENVKVIDGAPGRW